MADTPFNVSLGEVKRYAIRARDNATEALVVVLLQAAEADGALRDHDTLAALIAVAGNTEATFTNYARKVISGADVVVAVDDANDWVDVDVPDQTWVDAGGATNNGLVKLLLVFDPDTGVADDATMIPLTQHDFVVTTDGSDLTAQIAAGGFFRAS